jgi:glucose-6-phosphate 1-dehydrogenase
VEATLTPDTEALADRRADPCLLVIFGAGGDLTQRKLMPALYNLHCHALLPERFAILGVALKELDDASFRERLKVDLRSFATLDVTPAAWSDLERRLYYVRGDFEDAATYRKLARRIEELERTHSTRGNILFYLATPPSAFAEVVGHLGGAGLTQSATGWRRVVVEKPFGHDLDSARTLNRALRKDLAEEQIFRIDHYLGKETVQNLLVFRFANGLFEPIWNRHYIDDVQMTVAEELGVEARGGYYESAGALRDMIQTHLFQLMSLVAMEPPSTLEGEAVRNEKAKLLDAVKVMDAAEAARSAVRGQYGEGVVHGEKVPAYRSEPKVSPSSSTETYAAVKLVIDNWRWAGVPFYLRSGKRLARRDSEIVINFRRPPLRLFKQAGVPELSSNRLVIHVQPEEGIELTFKAKVPGPFIRLKTVQLAFNYREFGERGIATGYERLLHDVMIGDSTLFHREDMVEAAWKIAMPILELWESQPPRDFPNYAAGTWGPKAALELLERDQRRWIAPSEWR